jgi:hypothetical protein
MLCAAPALAAAAATALAAAAPATALAAAAAAAALAARHVHDDGARVQLVDAEGHVPAPDVMHIPRAGRDTGYSTGGCYSGETHL